MTSVYCIVSDKGNLGLPCVHKIGHFQLFETDHHESVTCVTKINFANIMRKFEQNWLREKFH